MNPENKLKLLVVEDDPLFGGVLLDVLEDAGYSARLAKSGGEALEAAVEDNFDLVLQDLNLPDSNGLDVLREILTIQPHCGSLVMTAYGSVDAAVEAIKLGAFDFLTKPFTMDALFQKISGFLELRQVQRSHGNPGGKGGSRSRIVTKSPAMMDVMKTVSLTAGSAAPVLIEGESGTGKELIAEAFHDGGARPDGPFIKVNCAAIPENLLESELFGVEKGAFTGADRSRAGLIEMASGGTLFLDEIGELPLHLQGKLLRVLEEKQISRLGATSFKQLDFRLVTATNRSLAEMVREETFRRDLYFRINVIHITLPPLRERKEDILLLLVHFLDKLFERNPLGKPTFSPEALELLIGYNYPGNIRELQNIVEMISLFHPGKVILKRHLPPELQKTYVAGSNFESFSLGKPLKEAVAEYEKKYIGRIVSQAGGQKAEAARILGISRKALWEKLNKIH